MIGFQEAQAKVLKAISPLPTVEVPLAEALGMVLAEAVRADRDVPPFDRAAMDGYAVAARDATSTPARLRVVGELLPGREPGFALSPGQAAAIMTGAPLPPGADAVQMVELCREEEGFVEIGSGLSPGQNVAPRGEDARAGDEVLRPGAVLGPGAISLLASVGRTRVAIRRRPRLAIFATGCEIVPPESTPSPTQLRNANGPALAARARVAGAEPLLKGIVGDDSEEIYAALMRAEEFDALVITGGVSMGRYDFVKDALRRADAETLFKRVGIKPGKPTTAALIAGKPVLALPGNPVSCLVAAELFLAPALRAMRGVPRPQSLIFRGELRGDVHTTGERTTLVPSRLTVEEGVPAFYPTTYHGSGDYIGFATAQALVIVPADVDFVEKHGIVEAVILEGTGWRNI